VADCADAQVKAGGGVRCAKMIALGRKRVRLPSSSKSVH
jgi:hypothetical protein